MKFVKRARETSVVAEPTRESLKRHSQPPRLLPAESTKRKTYATATAATSTTDTETKKEGSRTARHQRRRTDGRDRSGRRCRTGLGTKRQAQVAQSSRHAR